jgi:hypothetical protein
MYSKYMGYGQLRLCVLCAFVHQGNKPRLKGTIEKRRYPQNTVLVYKLQVHRTEHSETNTERQKTTEETNPLTTCTSLSHARTSRHVCRDVAPLSGSVPSEAHPPTSLLRAPSSVPVIVPGCHIRARLTKHASDDFYFSPLRRESYWSPPRPPPPGQH